MTLVIRKKVTCEFLGDEYQNAYLIFKAIPISDLADVQSSLPKGETDAEKLQVIPKMLEILKKYFLNGEFPNETGELEPVSKDDLNNANTELALHCFQSLTGVDQNLDLESKNSLTLSTQME